MNKPIFDFYSKYYDLLYSDKDYISETNYIVNLMARFELKGDDILEFGSGTGIHACLLAGKGYKVTGIERSEQMVNMARLVPGFTCQQGDICTVKLGRTFDAVLSLFHVVSYQTTNSAVQDVFARAADHLKPGGLFLFDVWYSPAVYAKRPEVRIKRISNETVEITRIAEPVMKSEQNRVDVNYTIFVRNIEKDEFEILKETHPIRHFSIFELDLFAQLYGFERLGAEEFLTGNSPSEDTWGVCFILKKI
jgi:SAM-dependent methyltransferase